MNYVFLEEWVS